jgi:hypothetical protein
VKKPNKKRKGDAVQVAHSVMQDIILAAEKSIQAPPRPRKKRR